ncbi:hypothetical protein [Streptomyces sp. SBT349]|uniref:hypothetical protein n=1 Tax=Streptomyces sp. SBT349 TaxID=1580539 RepID=UPI00066B8E8D|nr:hypothetical protein [Streptomyces sp. SBT349]
MTNSPTAQGDPVLPCLDEAEALPRVPGCGAAERVRARRGPTARDARPPHARAGGRVLSRPVRRRTGARAVWRAVSGMRAVLA